MDNRQIIRDYILRNEDDFMQYLEEEHEIEGSEMDRIIDLAENEAAIGSTASDYGNMWLAILKLLLLATGGRFVVGEQGNTLKVNIASEWNRKRPAAVELIYHLLHSEEAGALIDTLDDGIYDYHAVLRFLDR